MGSRASSRISSRYRLVTGTSAVGISQWSLSLNSPRATASASASEQRKRSSANLGNCPVPKRTLRVDHEGRQHFGIAVLLRVQVEHEADQRPLQPRARAHVDGKPRAAQLGGAFQVENAQRFAKFPVRLRAQSRRSASRPRSSP